jgi:hypothetical protein
MGQDLNQIGGKRTYEPPRVKTISLRPEEAVLGHCKISGVSGSVGSSCTAVGMPCNSLGS